MQDELIGMTARQAHWFLIDRGYHETAARHNEGVIFNLYKDGIRMIVLFISMKTMTVKEVVKEFMK